MYLPPALVPGDRVQVIAPSGPFDADLLRRGLEHLSDYQITGVDSLGANPKGFFAAKDEDRLQQLQLALDCPDTKAIWMARGGYGLARLLPRVSLDQFQRFPKWFVGFSDATALHHLLQRRNFASLHAPNGTTLHRLAAGDKELFLRALTGEHRQLHQALRTIQGGTAEGRIYGGNLTVLFAEAAAGRLLLPEGTLLFLEDVTETSYRIDRMLNALISGGHLSGVSGILLGEFTDCSEGKFGVPAAEVLEENLRPLGIPLLADFPAGHGAKNCPVPLGATARLDASRGEFEIFSK